LKAVVKKEGKIQGRFRTAGYTLIAGSGTVTMHRESGFTYCLDVNRSFFNPRLIGERMRVVANIREGERVLVPFSGVGPFVIPASARGATVEAVEQNPDACAWLRENIKMNGVAKNVFVIEGDAFDEGVLPLGPYDTAIVPAPYGRDGIFDMIACRMKRGGKVFLYAFKNRNQSETMRCSFEERGFRVLRMHRCGHVAPSVSRWVFDLLIP